MDEKTRDHYIEMAREQLLEFDKRILWLSAGALALTLAYVPSLNTTPSGVGVVLLLGGAALLTASLTVTLWLFQRSAKDIQIILETEDEALRQGQAVRMWRWNTISLGLFVLGVLALIAFAGVTLLLS